MAFANLTDEYFVGCQRHENQIVFNQKDSMPMPYKRTRHHNSLCAATLSVLLQYFPCILLLAIRLETIL